MAYIYNGEKRRTTLQVTRQTNGVTDTGYPKTYDIRNAFTGNGNTYGALGVNGDGKEEVALLSDAAFQQRETDFYDYVGQQTALGGAVMDPLTDLTNEAQVTDEATCPSGTAA